MASSTVDQAVSLIRERIRELDDEKAKLERALADLSGTRRGPGRPRGGSNSTARRRAASPARRRRKGGTRAEHALELIEKSPGISAGKIASELKISPNYMYRVMSDLHKAGHVRKEGRGYHLAGAAAAAKS